MAIPNWLHLSQVSGSGDTVITITADSYTEAVERLTDLIVTGNSKQVTVPVSQNGKHVVDVIDNTIRYRTRNHQTLPFENHLPVVSNTYDTANDIGTVVFSCPLTQLWLGGFNNERMVPTRFTTTASTGGYHWRNITGQISFWYEDMVDNVKEVFLPNSLVGINCEAFKNCQYLETLGFGKGMAQVGNSALTYTLSLGDFLLPQYNTIWFNDYSLVGCGVSSVTSNIMHEMTTNYLGGMNYSGDYQPGITPTGEIHVPSGATNILFPSTGGMSGWTKTYDAEENYQDLEIDTTSIVCDYAGAFSYDNSGVRTRTKSIRVLSHSGPWTAYTQNGDAFIATPSVTSGGTGGTNVTFTATTKASNSLKHQTQVIVFDNGNDKKYMRLTQYTRLLVDYTTNNSTYHVLPIGSVAQGHRSNSTWHIWWDSEYLAGYNYTLPDNAFSGGTYPGYTTGSTTLRTVTIRDGFNALGSKVFYDCSSLSAITCYCTACPAIQSDTFTGVKSTGTLHYPSGSDYSTWLAQLGPGWTGVGDL